jgi:hypothetical protein
MRAKLKILILEKFGSQSDFAKACRRNDNWISRIICERQKPTPKEMDLIAGKLGLYDIEDYIGK